MAPVVRVFNPFWAKQGNNYDDIVLSTAAGGSPHNTVAYRSLEVNNYRVVYSVEAWQPDHICGLT